LRTTKNGSRAFYTVIDQINALIAKICTDNRVKEIITCGDFLAKTHYKRENKNL